MIQPLAPGTPLPPWELEAFAGAPAPRVGDFRGRHLLVLFFSLFCPGCRYRAVPFANRLVVERSYVVTVLGIHTNFEGPELTDEQMAEAREELHIRFPVYRDAGIAATFYEYGAIGTPHWITVDPEGRVVANLFGSEPNRALLRLDYYYRELADALAAG